MTRATFALLAALALTALSGCGSDEPEPHPCASDCGDRVCGPDACGGSCGTCAEGTTCSAAGQCVSTAAVACPAGRQCVMESHVPWEWSCTPAPIAGTWDCAQLYPRDAVPSYSACRMICAGGNSSCGGTSSQLAQECLRCEESCVAAEYAPCAGATPETCTAPCACG